MNSTTARSVLSVQNVLKVEEEVAASAAGPAPRPGAAEVVVDEEDEVVQIAGKEKYLATMLEYGGSTHLSAV